MYAYVLGRFYMLPLLFLLCNMKEFGSLPAMRQGAVWSRAVTIYDFAGAKAGPVL